MATIADIARPKVLIITPHPVIGAGIETVLRLEDLYDVRRASTLTDGLATIGTWTADVALVDGVLLDPRAVDLGVPSYVLSGDAESGERLAEKVPGAKGWLLKDARRHGWSRRSIGPPGLCGCARTSAGRSGW